jgi:hypothetical protein
VTVQIRGPVAPPDRTALTQGALGLVDFPSSVGRYVSINLATKRARSGPDKFELEVRHSLGPAVYWTIKYLPSGVLDDILLRAICA